MLVRLTAKESKEKKALENPGAGAFLARMGGEGAGLPFYAFLDGRGRKIADSKSKSLPGGANIGFPLTPDEVRAFAELLKTAAPRMSDKEREAVAAYLSKKEPRSGP